MKCGFPHFVFDMKGRILSGICGYIGVANRRDLNRIKTSINFTQIKKNICII